MKRITLICTVAFLILVMFTLFGPLVRYGDAKPAYSKKEGAKCATCHVKAGAKELTPVGECYKVKKDLAGCQEATK